MEWAGTSGRPLARAAQVAPPSVLLKTCVTPKVEYVAHARLSLLGS